jgi:hypothetical protein
MRAKEFIIESADDSTISDSLPATYAISKLPNSDFYKQYRFGVAIAAARGDKARESVDAKEMEAESIWGENQIIIGYAQDTEVIDDALTIMGLGPEDKESLSSIHSRELRDTDSKSPVSSFRGYGK